MNKIIEEQLKKCQVAELSDFDSASGVYHIKRFKQAKMEVDACYLIRIGKHLLNRDTSQMLASNWNKGTVPPCEYMKIDVVKSMGKMIRVNGIGYESETKQDLNCVWSGWLPLRDIEVIERI